MSDIQELDIDQLDADLYRTLEAMQKGNYGIAETKVWRCWDQIRQFRLSLDDRHLPATTDRDWRALLTKAWYWLLNRKPLRCRLLGYNCEWVYPYGWVPQGGCPDHD